MVELEHIILSNFAVNLGEKPPNVARRDTLRDSPETVISYRWLAAQVLASLQEWFTYYCRIKPLEVKRGRASETRLWDFLLVWVKPGESEMNLDKTSIGCVLSCWVLVVSFCEYHIYMHNLPSLLWTSLAPVLLYIHACVSELHWSYIRESSRSPHFSKPRRIAVASSWSAVMPFFFTIRDAANSNFLNEISRLECRWLSVGVWGWFG